MGLLADEWLAARHGAGREAEEEAQVTAVFGPWHDRQNRHQRAAEWCKKHVHSMLVIKSSRSAPVTFTHVPIMAGNYCLECQREWAEMFKRWNRGQPRLMRLERFMARAREEPA